MAAKGICLSVLKIGVENHLSGRNVSDHFDGSREKLSWHIFQNVWLLEPSYEMMLMVMVMMIDPISRFIRFNEFSLLVWGSTSIKVIRFFRVHFPSNFVCFCWLALFFSFSLFLPFSLSPSLNYFFFQTKLLLLFVEFCYAFRSVLCCRLTFCIFISPFCDHLPPPPEHTFIFSPVLNLTGSGGCESI